MVVNALQSALVDRVAMDGGHAVAHSHAAKVKKYEACCTAEGMMFLLLAVETFSGWHKVALETLAKLGCHLARVVGRDESYTVRHFRQRLSVILIWDNIQMLLSRTPDTLPSQITGEF